MTLTPGTRLGPYEIGAQIGAGGMGEVYRATDTNLARQVAVKVLPEWVATDPERLARFDREARTLAALNHPNIAQIYGLERTAGQTALVMELVEGPTLAELITRRAGPFGPAAGPSGPAGLAVDEALPIAKQICEALEAAHEQAIIHRDLKPANIKVRDDGTVKVLDFGLAKALAPADAMDRAGRGFSPAGPAGPEDPACTHSPTITSPALLTGAGMILGTAAYMSPEQAKGRPADRRTDIWAFGCVLYEMLTGRRAFDGEDVADTMASVLKADVDWSRIPPAVPSHVVTVLRRCLQRDRARRARDIGDVALALEGGFAGTGAPVDPDTLVTTRTQAVRAVRVWQSAALLLALVAIAAVVVPFSNPRESPAGEAVVQFTVGPPDGATLVTPDSATGLARFALSADGQSLAFVAVSAEGRQQLWVRGLGDSEARPLPGTDGAQSPFWSPDGRFVGFFAQNRLRVVDVAEGTTRILAEAPNASGGSWSSSNVILFSSGRGEGLRAVDAGGNGDARRVTEARAERTHRWPEFLPDGQRFLYAVTGGEPGVVETWVGSLDGDAPELVLRGEGGARYAPPGYLLFSQGGALMAQAVDPGTIRAAGTPVRLADGAANNPPSGYSAIAVSRTGNLAYAGSYDPLGEAVWRSRSGAPIAARSRVDSAVSHPAFSPDGARLAVARALPQTARNVWLYDAIEGGSPLRFTFEGSAASPIWSPDGTYIAFRASRERLDQIYLKRVEGSGDPEMISDKSGSIPTDWSRDGQWLFFQSGPAGVETSSWDLFRVSVDTRTTEAIIATPFNEVQAALSPDGRWVAYASDETGSMEVYVESFPTLGAKRALSRGGGTEPRWRADGRELYYVSADRRLTAVPMTTSPALQIGQPEPLFATNMRQPVHPFARRYDVSPDGQRFVLLERSPETEEPEISVVVNWPALLNR